MSTPAAPRGLRLWLLVAAPLVAQFGFVGLGAAGAHVLGGDRGEARRANAERRLRLAPDRGHDLGTMRFVGLLPGSALRPPGALPLEAPRDRARMPRESMPAGTRSRSGVIYIRASRYTYLGFPGGPE